jgi:hypothetical protein
LCAYSKALSFSPSLIRADVSEKKFAESIFLRKLM